MTTTHRQHDPNQCLSCDSKDVAKRGLCLACYEQYRRERDKLPASQRDHFDDELIALKLLAADARRASNVFAKTREKVAREFAEKEIGVAESQVDAYKAKNQATRKPSTPRKKAN